VVLRFEKLRRSCGSRHPVSRDFKPNLSAPIREGPQARRAKQNEQRARRAGLAGRQTFATGEPASRWVRIRHGEPLHFAIEARIYWLCADREAALRR